MAGGPLWAEMKLGAEVEKVQEQKYVQALS
jgi:hypothetical protein